MRQKTYKNEWIGHSKNENPLWVVHHHVTIHVCGEALRGPPGVSALRLHHLSARER